ncbi:MAG: DsbA family protein [Patescibacteria group bacterium]
MNTKRIIFWLGFVVVFGLIIWGLVVAMNKPPVMGLNLGAPAPVTEADHVRGSADAPVTLIEYSDFQCPACAIYYPLVERLLSESTTTVRFVYRHYPLYPQPHKNAFIASQAAEAAGLQGKFWEMYQLLFDNQKSWENLPNTESVFEGYATRIGLNTEAFKKDLASDSVKKRVQRDRDEGISLGVNSTPTFFVNGKAIVNPQSYEAFKKIIDDAARGDSN